MSEKSVHTGGGSFDAVIVKSGEIIAEASNTVTLDHDPTAYTEMNAVRQAAHELGIFDLIGYDICTSHEPCSMCLGVIYWIHLGRIYYANNRKDAAHMGFGDDFIYHEATLRPTDQHKQMQILLPEEARKAFDMQMKSKGKTTY